MPPARIFLNANSISHLKDEVCLILDDVALKFEKIELEPQFEEHYLENRALYDDQLIQFWALGEQYRVAIWSVHNMYQLYHVLVRIKRELLDKIGAFLPSAAFFGMDKLSANVG
jgi:hypothetical protein